MSKIISTKKTSAIFLAIVLSAGTIFTFSSSFMIPGAQAFLMDNNYEQDYGMDSYDKKPYGKDSNNYDKSKDSNNVKCNNINVNVNGFNRATLPTALSGLATDDEAQASDEGQVGASSFESGGSRPSGHDSDSRFVCINNNNNDVNEGNGDGTDECPEAEEIESCFRQFLLDFLFPNFVDKLESEAGITVEIN